MKRGQLAGARARECRFVKSDLRKAVAAGADFEYADFSYANLELADFSRTNLSGANMHVTLKDTTNLDGARTKGMRGTDLDLLEAETWKPKPTRL